VAAWLVLVVTELLDICGCLVNVGGYWVVGYLWLLGQCWWCAMILGPC